MRRWRSRFGNLLALVALCLQLVASALPVPQASPTAQDDFAALLRLHALCLGSDTAQTRPEAPAQDRPDGVGHHVGACCFLHGNASSCLLPPSTSEPVAFELSEATFSAQAITEVAAHPFATPRARAPPQEV